MKDATTTFDRSYSPCHSLQFIYHSPASSCCAQRYSLPYFGLMRANLDISQRALNSAQALAPTSFLILLPQVINNVCLSLVLWTLEVMIVPSEPQGVRHHASSQWVACVYTDLVKEDICELNIHHLWVWGCVQQSKHKCACKDRIGYSQQCAGTRRERKTRERSE